MVALVKSRQQQRARVANFFGKGADVVKDAAAVLEELEAENETLPPITERIFGELMDKKVITSKGIDWQTRFAVLGTDKLSFTSGPADDAVIEFIPLYEIEQVYLEDVDAVNGHDSGCNVLNAKESKKPGSIPAHLHRTASILDGVDVVVAVHDAKTRQEVLSRLEKQEQAQSHRIPEKQLTIATIDGGYNAGKTFIYRLHGKDKKMAHEAFHDFVFREIKQAVKIAKAKERNRLIWLEHGDSILSMLRKKTAIMHESQPFQIAVATLIIAGFCIDLAEAQVLPEPNSGLDLLFFRIDLALTAFFVVEFAINLFAKSRNWFEEFLGSKHDMFDLVIVMISVLAIAGFNHIYII